MFGYIRPVAGELFVKENEFYKAVYCGLCREGGRHISPLTRFFLNNDFVFLCIIRMAANGEKAHAEKKRCPYGLKKKCMVCGSESELYTAASFGLLLYYKLKDDIADSKWYKRLASRFLLMLAKPMKRRAAKLYPVLAEKLGAHLSALSELEKEKSASPDRVADCFAKVTAETLSGGITENGDILYECGYHIGRYVYLIDAYDDCVSDEKSGSFNVLNGYYGSSAETLAKSDEIRVTLNDSIRAFSRAYAKLGGNTYDHLIYNIAELGSAQAFERVKEKHGGNTRNRKEST